MGVGSVLLLFMFAFVYSKITLQRYEKNVMQQKEKDMKRLSDLFYI